MLCSSALHAIELQRGLPLLMPFVSQSLHYYCSGSGDLKKYLDNFTYGWPSEDKFLYTANGTEASCG